MMGNPQITLLYKPIAHDTLYEEEFIMKKWSALLIAVSLGTGVPNEYYDLCGVTTESRPSFGTRRCCWAYDLDWI